MINATLTTGEATIAEIAHRRFMERERFLLWQNYIAASNLYMGMLGKPELFDGDDCAAQYEDCRGLEIAHDILDETYHNLYQQPDGTEQD